MIPKIIHLCWLSGDPYPPLISNCIDSWVKKLPDYEIKVWSKNSFDINSVKWVKEAVQQKKYAFAADYIRFYALYNFGGIYLDADVEVLKSFNPLLNYEYFLGEEASGDVEAAVIGAQKGLPWLKECLDYYSERSFLKSNGKMDLRPVPLLLNRIKNKYNLSIFPFYFFSPKDYILGKISVKKDSYTIHHFDGKWVKTGIKPMFKRYIHKTLYLFLGRRGHNYLIYKFRFIKSLVKFI